MDTWNPTQYEKFKGEREQPFLDLLALVTPTPNPRVLDLGCGTGALTAQAHARLGTGDGRHRSLARMLDAALKAATPPDYDSKSGRSKRFSAARST